MSAIDLSLANVTGGVYYGNIRANSYVLNLGTDKEYYPTVKYYLSSDQVITTGDAYIGQAVPYNTTGANGIVAAIPSTLAPGVYYIGAIVDPDNLVDEYDEGNNALSTSTAVITIQ